MKKIVAFMIAIVMTLSFCACNNTADISPVSDTTSEATNSTSAQPELKKNTVEIPELPVVNANSMTYLREYQLDYFQGAEYNTFLFPKITIETETVAALNLLMLTEVTQFGDDTDYAGGIYNYVSNATEPITDLRCNVYVNYQYSVQNDVIAIVIEYYKSYFSSEMLMSVLDYYYDIKNDKILSLEQYLETQNVTVREIIATQAKAYPDLPFTSPDDVNAVICNENGICKVYGAGINGLSAYDLDLKNNTEATVISSDLARYFATTYQKARGAYCWFRMGSMPLSEKTIQRADYNYNKVNHPTIKSVVQLKEYMSTLFDQQIVDELFKKDDNFPEKYIDVEGELYCLDTARGSDNSVGDEVFEIIKKTDNEYIFRIKCETLNFDTNSPVVDGTKTVDQIITKHGDGYVFTKFELTR